MRRHAKACSVGSVKGSLPCLGSSGAARGRFPIVFALVLAAALALCASPALAATAHPDLGSFGPDGAGGTESFGSVRGLAVDSGNGDVYVYDFGGEKIYKFDSSRQPANFTATGTNAISGVGGEAHGGSLANEWQLAVAPAGSPGGTGGDIYLANDETQGVQVYSAAGTRLGEVEQGGGEVCGVATDPSGNLYAGVYPEAINKFTPTANPPTTANKTTAVVPQQRICNVAADGLGNVYAASFMRNPSANEGGLFKLEGMSDPTPTEVDATANAVAVAPGSNDVYTLHEDGVFQYGPAGTLLDSFGSGGRSIAVSSGGTRTYVGGEGRVQAYGLVPNVPDATTKAATGVTRTAATLNGTISADNEPAASCTFQYATVAQHAANGFEGAAEAPCSPSGPFTGSSTVPVSAELAGLQQGTGYVFRLLGVNSNGETSGGELDFSTPSLVNAVTGPATAVTASTATLNATVDPEGVELEGCQFVYGKFPNLEFTSELTVPCAETPAEIGHGNGPVAVHADIVGLTRAIRYGFHIAVSFESGIENRSGANQFFTTRTPVIEAESLVNVTQTGATFKATVNPNGEATSYHFEYVTEAEFEASGFDNATKLPPSGESIGAGTKGVQVEQEVTGLSLVTAYRVRVVAENGGGTTIGEELPFMTAFGQPPGLPDGRAYEQATPVDKNGGNAQGEHNEVRTSPAGNGITYIASGGIPGAEGAQNLSTFLALRSPTGWASQGLMPSAEHGAWANVQGLSEDLSTEYAAAAVPAAENSTFEIDTSNREYTTIYHVVKKSFRAASTYLTSTANGSLALFKVTESLGEGAAGFGVPNLYLWDRATQKFILVGVMNSGEAPEEGVDAGGFGYFVPSESPNKNYLEEENALSVDGSHIFFTTKENSQLYMRVNPTQPQSAMNGDECTEPAKACTNQVSKSQRSTPDPEGTKNAKFVSANADGSKVFFMSAEDLTDDANTGPSELSNDLYMYDTNSHVLTDITASTPAENPNGAEVAGILGMSEDGSYVYFGAGGVFAPGATQGSCDYRTGKTGVCNVYLWHEGAPEPISFVAKLEATSSSEGHEWLSKNWAPEDSVNGSQKTARVSADGQTLVFASATNLTSYDSGRFLELYRYRVGDSGLLCLSCSPTGEPATADATFESITPGFLAPRSYNGKNPRNMSADGNRVFFESNDRLVAADTNGVQDVYEWEAGGAGSCATAHQNGGCLFLISSGTSPQRSYFGDASESGNDVYFFTNQPLVGQDRDQLADVYDARVGGGFAYQYPPPSSICSGEACRPGASAPPATQSPATSTNSGPGNPQPRKHHKKHHKKKHKKHKKHHAKGTKSERGNR